VGAISPPPSADVSIASSEALGPRGAIFRRPPLLRDAVLLHRLPPGVGNDLRARLVGVRAVIMNGGGADLLLGSCDPLSPDCPLLTEAASAVTDLLNRMTADGVERIVYVFYPDYADPDLRSEMDVLRPLLETACAASASCRWVDLRSTFVDHSADYLEANGFLPTGPGAQASAQAIWSVLEPGCVTP
jgi:hypothetical protein